MLKIRIMAQIYLINGPNLNRLGRRDPVVYGRETLAQLEGRVARRLEARGHALVARQSNREGALIDFIQEAVAEGARGIILNPGGYSHTSVALHDAIADAREMGVFVVEVHISHIYAREDFRRVSVTGRGASGMICGLGTEGYLLAADYLLTLKGGAGGKKATRRKTASKKTARKKATSKKTTRKKVTRKTTRRKTTRRGTTRTRR